MIIFDDFVNKDIVMGAYTLVWHVEDAKSGEKFSNINYWYQNSITNALFIWYIDAFQTEFLNFVAAQNIYFIGIKSKLNIYL